MIVLADALTGQISHCFGVPGQKIGDDENETHPIVRPRKTGLMVYTRGVGRMILECFTPFGCMVTL